MTHKEVETEFEEQLAALEAVALSLDQVFSLLLRFIEGKIAIKNPDNKLIRVVLTHFIINNLTSLFDDGADRNSLTKIAQRFKRNFPDDFFSEYTFAVDKIRKEYVKDLKRIRKNRNLSTAHLSASRRERLGYSHEVAKNIKVLIGEQVPIAKDDSLVSITPNQIFDMSILLEIKNLRKVLGDLNIAYKQFQAKNAR